jgi:hypothetical protein
VGASGQAVIPVDLDAFGGVAAVPEVIRLEQIVLSVLGASTVGRRITRADTCLIVIVTLRREGDEQLIDRVRETPTPIDRAGIVRPWVVQRQHLCIDPATAYLILNVERLGTQREA